MTIYTSPNLYRIDVKYAVRTAKKEELGVARYPRNRKDPAEMAERKAKLEELSAWYKKLRSKLELFSSGEPRHYKTKAEAEAEFKKRKLDKKVYEIQEFFMMGF